MSWLCFRETFSGLYTILFKRCLSYIIIGRKKVWRTAYIDSDNRRAMRVNDLLVTADPRKRYGRLNSSRFLSPTLLGTDYKSPHLWIFVYESK